MTPAAEIVLERVRLKRLSQTEVLAEAALVDTRLSSKIQGAAQVV